MGDKEKFYISASSLEFQIGIQLLKYMEHHPLLVYLVILPLNLMRGA